jgi:hypothetical protein
LAGKNGIWLRPLAFGAIASFSMLAAYFAVLSALNSFSHAASAFLELWVFMVPLVVGFGVQIALFVYIRNAHRHLPCGRAETASTAGVSAASGSVSGTAMVACCLHHATDILPLAGFSAAALFFSRFQKVFLLLGVFGTASGILMMLNIIKKHSLYPKEHTLMGAVLGQNLELALRGTLVIAAVSIGIMLAITA